jgi:sirohydrochlorin cobaltochelatase
MPGEAVILFSHGSVLCGAGDALEAHATRLRENGDAGVVEIGYLNYSEPPFAQTVERCAEMGVTRIIVTPYFLAPGYFVRVEMTKAIEAARAKHPGIEFIASAPLGFDEGLACAIIESAHSARTRETWRGDMDRAAQSCRANRECPLYGSPGCPAAGLPR